jgi:hypothetical protein
MMSGVGYSKFFWSDWRSDPKLRMCSLAARGLWIDMLSLMAEASPKGELRIGNSPITTAQLATIISAPFDDVERAFSELEKAGVFSRTRAGVPYSRRMCRDQKRRRTSMENGKMGGNPALEKQWQHGDYPVTKVRNGGAVSACSISENLSWDNPPLNPLLVHPVPAKEENPIKGVFSLASEPVPEMTPEDEERRRLKVEAAKSRLGYDSRH